MNPFKKRAAMKRKGKYVSFKALVARLRKKGYSEERAKEIAASVGRKIYGKRGMAQLATRGRKEKK